VVWSPQHPLRAWSSTTTTSKYRKQRATKGEESRAALHFGGFESKSCIIFGRNCMLGCIEEGLIAQPRISIMWILFQSSNLNVILIPLGQLMLFKYEENSPRISAMLLLVGWPELCAVGQHSKLQLRDKNMARLRSIIFMKGCEGVGES